MSNVLVTMQIITNHNVRNCVSRQRTVDSISLTFKTAAICISLALNGALHHIVGLRMKRWLVIIWNMLLMIFDHAFIINLLLVLAINHINCMVFPSQRKRLLQFHQRQRHQVALSLDNVDNFWNIRKNLSVVDKST